MSDKADENWLPDWFWDTGEQDRAKRPRPDFEAVEQWPYDTPWPDMTGHLRAPPRQYDPKSLMPIDDCLDPHRFPHLFLEPSIFVREPTYKPGAALLPDKIRSPVPTVTVMFQYPFTDGPPKPIDISQAFHAQILAQSSRPPRPAPVSNPLHDGSPRNLDGLQTLDDR